MADKSSPGGRRGPYYQPRDTTVFLEKRLDTVEATCKLADAIVLDEERQLRGDPDPPTHESMVLHESCFECIVRHGTDGKPMDREIRVKGVEGIEGNKENGQSNTHEQKLICWKDEEEDFSKEITRKFRELGWNDDSGGEDDEKTPKVETKRAEKKIKEKL